MGSVSRDKRDSGHPTTTHVSIRERSTVNVEHDRQLIASFGASRTNDVEKQAGFVCVDHFETREPESTTDELDDVSHRRRDEERIEQIEESAGLATD